VADVGRTASAARACQSRIANHLAVASAMGGAAGASASSDRRSRFTASSTDSDEYSMSIRSASSRASSGRRSCASQTSVLTSFRTRCLSRQTQSLGLPSSARYSPKIASASAYPSGVHEGIRPAARSVDAVVGIELADDPFGRYHLAEVALLLVLDGVGARPCGHQTQHRKPTRRDVRHGRAQIRPREPQQPATGMRWVSGPVRCRTGFRFRGVCGAGRARRPRSHTLAPPSGLSGRERVAVHLMAPAKQSYGLSDISWCSARGAPYTAVGVARSGRPARLRAEGSPGGSTVLGVVVDWLRSADCAVLLAAGSRRPARRASARRDSRAEGSGSAGGARSARLRTYRRSSRESGTGACPVLGDAWRVCVR
jgi:hypothetical protein